MKFFTADSTARHDAALPQLGRFLGVGAASFALNLLILWLGTGVLGAHYLASALFSLLLVGGASFAVQRRWVFASQRANWTRELGRFYVVNSGAFALNLALMALLVSVVGVPYLWASGLVGIGLTALNFVLHRNWSFSRR